MHKAAPIATMVLALVMVLMVGGHLPPLRAQSMPASTPAQDIREALVSARREAARAQERAAVLDRQARAATAASERATIAAAALAARVQQAEAALVGTEASLALVRAKRRALDTRLAREREPVARLLAGLQTLVRRPALLTMLQPGSIEDAVHVRAVVAAIGPQIDLRTATLRQTLSRVAALESEAAKVVSQRRQLAAELAEWRRDLAAASAVERLKARRAAGAADREAERAYAVSEEARDLATLSRRLTTRSAMPANRGRARGKLAVLPSYRLPVAGAIAPSVEGGADGVTMIPSPGALAVAPAAGRVAFAGPYRGYGRIVIVEHADGWASLVTGLASLHVAIGQQLVAGSPIGEAPARKPAIGLELRRNGERMNPLDQLR